MGHETHRISSESGEAPSSCGGTVERRERNSRDWPPCSRLAWSSPSLDSGLEKTRNRGAHGQTDSRQAQEADHEAEQETRETPSRWGNGFGLSQRAVDFEANRDFDSQGIWSPISSEPSLARAPIRGLELSGAGEARDPA